MSSFCGKCGSEINPESSECPNCGAPQSSKPEKQPRPRRLIMIFALLGVVVCAAWGIRSSLICEHTWVDATCAEPRTCSECGATEGNPLSHQWQNATCTAPRTCSLCGQEDGEPLGHTLGEWEETCDILNAQQLMNRRCTVCDDFTESEAKDMTTFLKGDSFLFTMDQFSERLYAELRSEYPDPSVLKIEEVDRKYSNGSNVQRLLVYEVTYFGEKLAEFICYDSSDRFIPIREKRTTPVWSVFFSVPDGGCAEGLRTAQTMFSAMASACDPALQHQELGDMTTCWREWLTRCAPGGWYISMQARNGLIYQVGILEPNSNPKMYGTVFATSHLSDSPALQLSEEQTKTLETPNYTTKEAEQILTGTWIGRTILVEIDGELYTREMDNPDEDYITLEFQSNHWAVMNIERFSFEGSDASFRNFWNGRPIQWDYLYDTGDSLYYLFHTPYITASIPYRYDTSLSTYGTVRVWLAQNVSVLFEKQ